MLMPRVPKTNKPASARTTPVQVKHHGTSASSASKLHADDACRPHRARRCASAHVGGLAHLCHRHTDGPPFADRLGLADRLWLTDTPVLTGKVGACRRAPIEFHWVYLHRVALHRVRSHRSASRAWNTTRRDIADGIGWPSRTAGTKRQVATASRAARSSRLKPELLAMSTTLGNSLGRYLDVTGQPRPAGRAGRISSGYTGSRLRTLGSGPAGITLSPFTMALLRLSVPPRLTRGNRHRQRALVAW